MNIKSIDKEYQNNIDNFIFNDSITEKPVITQKNHNEIITYEKNKRSIKNSNQQQNQQQNQQPNQQPNQLPNKTSIKKYIIIIIIIVAIVIIALALFLFLRKKKEKDNNEKNENENSENIETKEIIQERSKSNEDSNI